MKPFVRWSGKIDKTHRTWVYDLYFSPTWLTDVHPKDLGTKWCHRDLMLRHIKDYGQEICSWGFMSDGTRQLALAVIGYALTMGATPHIGRCPSEDRKIKLALKHHEAFAEEVMANLPDKWTMTSDEIIQWIEEQE